MVSGVRRPIGATVLTLFGGLLILIEGALLVFVGSAVGTEGYVAVGGAVSALGTLLGFLGFVLVLLAFGIFANPAAHRGLGIVVVVLSFVSFLGGGGFVIGAILGVLGGILAIVFDASDVAPAPAPSSAPGRDRTCPKCGKLVSGAAMQCPFCQAAV